MANITKDSLIEYYKRNLQNVSDINKNIILDYIKDYATSHKLNTIGAFKPSQFKLFFYLNKFNITQMKEEELLSVFKVDQRNIYQTTCYDFLRYLFKSKRNKEMKNNESLYLFLENPTINTTFINDLLNKKIRLQDIVYSLGRQGYCKFIVSKLDKRYREAFIKFGKEKGTIFNSDLIYTDVFISLNNHFKNLNVKDVFSDMTDEIIETYFENNINLDKRALAISRSFISWCLSKMEQEKINKNIKIYTPYLLNYTKFIVYFIDGARPYIYNPLDKVPSTDKWFLIPSALNSGSTRVRVDTVKYFDFSKIVNKQMKNLLKRFIWVENDNFEVKLDILYLVTNFFNTYYPVANQEINEFNTMYVANYKTIVLSKYKSVTTQGHRIYPLFKFIKYLDNNTDIKVSKEVYLYGQVKGSDTRNKAKSVPVSDLKIICDYIDNHKYDTMEDTIFYVAFHLSLNTEFRISQILSLKIDCVKPSMKANEYVIKSVTKVSGGEEIEQPCARIVKGIIDGFLDYSSTTRENCKDKEMKDYLFIRYIKSKETFTTLNDQFFSGRLKQICEILDLPKYNHKNLRATYITNAKEFAMKNNLNDLTLLAVTNHKSVDMINNHYIEQKIRSALEATNKVIIGNIDIKGNVLENTSNIKSSKDVEVENRCGFCQSNNCETNGVLTCLICKHFATTVDRLPFFEMYLKVIDERILKAEYQHDIDDLNNIKRLLVAYMERILLIKEGEKNDNFIS